MGLRCKPNGILFMIPRELSALPEIHNTAIVFCILSEARMPIGNSTIAWLKEVALSPTSVGNIFGRITDI